MTINRDNLIRIVIIEDNQFIRSGWEIIFGSSPGIEVVGSYQSCEDAFSNGSIGEADITLMDIKLPGMSGIEGLKYLKQHYPEMHTLMCTIHEDDTNIFNAICEGAVGFIAKKTQPDDLLCALRNVANGGSPMTPNVARIIRTLFQKSFMYMDNHNCKLSDKEQNVLNRIAFGESYTSVARVLSTSVYTVTQCIREIYKKTLNICITKKERRLK